jgi:PAS domain S-box-containing protein
MRRAREFQPFASSGRRTIIAIFVTFGLFSALSLSLSISATSGSQNRATVVVVAARQRTLAERYVKEVLLVRAGRTADPAMIASLLAASTHALLNGGVAPAVPGDDDDTAVGPAGGTVVRNQLFEEERLVRDLSAFGSALLAHRPLGSVPVAGGEHINTSDPLQRLRILGALTSVVALNVSRSIAAQADGNINSLLVMQVVLGVVGLLVSLLLAWGLMAITRRQTAHFRSLVTGSTDLVLLLGANGCRYASRSLSTMVGRPERELLRNGFEQFVHDDDRAALAQARRTGEPRVIQLRVRNEAGEWRELEAHVTDLRADRHLRGVLLNARDVTERNRAAAELEAAHDEAVEASNMKSAFLANVSHEIRTPMNGVLGMNELLLDTPLSGEQRDYAEQVARSGEQMLALINDILDVSKIEAGQLDLDIGDFDLRDAIEQACSVAAVQAATKGLGFDVAIADEVPRQAQGDSRRVRQVLLNLVTNAVKFTAEGSVAVRARVRQAPVEGELVRIEVTDTGIGIDPEIVEQMFEPFTQADASTTRHYGGTGLGLAIVRELVELMGGTVGCDSKPGAGSTFFFELPLAPAEADARPAGSREGAASPAGSLWARRPAILVVEDSPVNQVVAVRTLERCGCDAEAVGNGQQALSALSRRAYDAVLMDCQMSGMDGYEATAELRRREAGGRRTPVIAMTALVMASDIERCLAVGMDDYVSKPIRREELVAALQRWIAPQESAAAEAPKREVAMAAPAGES